MRVQNVTVSFRVPESLVSKLQKAARRQNITFSKYVRNLLEANLNGKDKREVSCYDLTAHLIGKSSGPKDLSTNRKYMRAFGKSRIAGK